MIPTGRELPRFDLDTQLQIMNAAKGIKLRLTDAVLNRAHLLISTLGCPGVGGDGPVSSGEQRREL